MGRRKAALSRFLTSLSRPRPRQKPITRTPEALPFEVGDCVAVSLADGRQVGVVVTRRLDHPKAASLIVSVADVIQTAMPAPAAFTPLRWLMLAPEQFPNLVVKFQVYAGGYARHQKRYCRIGRVALADVPEPLVLRPATWATLWKLLPDAIVLTP